MRPFTAALRALIVPRRVTFAVPLPLTKVKPAVVASVALPFVADRVNCSTWTAGFTSGSPRMMALLLASENTNGTFSFVACVAGACTVGGWLTGVTGIGTGPGAVSVKNPSVSVALLLPVLGSVTPGGAVTVAELVSIPVAVALIVPVAR